MRFRCGIRSKLMAEKISDFRLNSDERPSEQTEHTEVESLAAVLARRWKVGPTGIMTVGQCRDE